ncbi:MAG: XisI protein [Cyanobacteriota bacterium]|nr:XisI protein [Cyanobacteriota bacterium]
MEKINYSHLVMKILTTHFEQLQKSGNTRSQLIIDAERHHYLLMTVGWNEQRREYGSLIHIDIQNDKIWIQNDGTEVGIAKELVEAGVPQANIVLGYKSPFKRQFTDYALC